MNARLLASLAAASFVLGSSVCSAQTTAAGTEERVTRNAEGRGTDHPADELRDPTTYELLRRKPGEVAVKPRATGGSKGMQKPLSSGESWIYDATTDFYVDTDADGYYRFLRVQLDADTIHTQMDVYAEIYLSADGESWELLYATKDFSIWGTDDDDDYEVETELVSGYTTGLYDVLVELYDSDTGEFLDEFGPNESPDFSLLPLEDSGRDGIVVTQPPITIIEEHGGGGAVSWLALAGLAGALALRRRRTATN
ncbi:MAG TPA: choice-of-anchor H family protein [Gammaproteobacteria bacterium]